MLHLDLAYPPRRCYSYFSGYMFYMMHNFVINNLKA
jgi:hypothetical protein